MARASTLELLEVVVEVVEVEAGVAEVAEGKSSLCSFY